MNEVQLAAGARIDLGALMILDAGEGAPRMKARLIGLAPGEFLILQAVSWGRGVAGSVIAGAPLTVRYLHGGRVFGFRCHSLGLSPAPRSVLFLGYPDQIEEHNLRKAERVACLLPATLRHGEEARDVLVVDMSLDGCLCTLRQPAGPSPFSTVGLDLRLGLCLPGVDGALELAVKLRNLNAQADELRLGLSFESVSATALAALTGFLSAVTR